MRSLYTTGEVARICKVSSSQVLKWFDQGQLKGFILPGSTHRRITRESLIAFLKRTGTELKFTELSQTNVVMLLSCDQEMIEAIDATLIGTHCRLLNSVNAFQIGQFVREARGKFCLAVVDMRLTALDPIRISRILIERNWQVIQIADRGQPITNRSSGVFCLLPDPKIVAAKLLFLLTD